MRLVKGRGPILTANRAKSSNGLPSQGVSRLVLRRPAPLRTGFKKRIIAEDRFYIFPTDSTCGST